ncbi:atypical kinase COQ8B, mitochondrial isoform X2 [Eurytemora carolleeae]|uniref:atypical kinase COQ8B, mitochondrial isoform X2 n=1 Tax=Eurytemora carolleeae TaxID=1294199 RepID=UPI000C78237C|nr:atypical kinase COQ8B, mitochondrial isoform X2 [Eurytemora carolleeae]|eukprot:XP_023329507.1 atypical kinase COQ8B, mitochondrial-like isoform X2 [Eurytemora affinis]
MTDIQSVLNSTYIKPVAKQTLEILYKAAGSNQSSDKTVKTNKSSSKDLGLEQTLQNLPLVVHGINLYARVLAGIDTSHSSSGSGLRTAEKSTAAQDSSMVGYTLELNPEVGSLDLLHLDITNEAVLRERLLRKVPIEIKHPPPPRVEPDKGSKVEVKLLDSSRERRVPATRLSRVFSFGSLGVGLGLGVMAEASRRAVGIRPSGSSGAKLEDSMVLTEANAERIVSTLCKVRGAALKLGQILSIQDNAILSPALAAIFDRVRESADFMPLWQLEKVMVGQLGTDWESKYSEFQTKPFAAASIGQVHFASLHDGTKVAVKVQYPGVAKSIDSDISNLMSLLSIVAILPQGLFIDNIAKHMKQELAEECDYKREAECGRRMKENLSVYPEYYVPKVYLDLSTDQVLTTEYITGLTIDRCVDLPAETRNYIAEAILKLVFRELFLHRYMQTDPNWANFLFNPETNKIGLLDFGATREFGVDFVNTYFKIIDAAARKDQESVLKWSREIGFLTGSESKAMNEAHVNSVMLLAVPFHNDAIFDFGKQTITQEIQELSGVMLKERLCPPPPEVYSLHRKLSGLFLLAGKLDAKFNCYNIWNDIRSRFKPFEKTMTS